MPRRNPIIPGFSGSKQLLRALHSEMRERKVLQDDQSTSSGIHSNSDVSDNSELAKKQAKNSNETRYANTMGRTALKRVEYDYSDDKAEREYASSSSGPDDDGDDEDDVSDDENDDVGNEENDYDDGSNGSESDDDDDGFDEEKDAKVTDDQIAWEVNTSVQRNDLRNYGISYGSSYGTTQAQSVGRAGAALSNRRVSGPISHARQLKETDDEIELIRRKYCQARERQQHIDDQRAHQLSAERQREIKEKRMSAGSISFLYGRRQPKQLPSGADYLNQTKGQTIEQVRLRSKSNPREMEERARLLQMSKRRSLQLPVSAGLSVKPVQEAPKPKPRTATSISKNDDSDIEFPLKDLAAGHSQKPIGMTKAKSLERDAKRKTKALKGSIENAKLDVAEARLGEFAAKLKARQARIEERQAKLCRRRAILKRMEDELIGLETKLDEEEEDHRARERRIKNRERRVKQEEAGIRLKEESLRKREAMVSEGIEKIEQRRKLVEEKEVVHNAMEEIMAKKEEIHGREVARLEKQNKGGFFGKISRKSGKDRAPNTRIQPSKSNYSELTHSSASTTLITDTCDQQVNSRDSSQQNDSSTGYKTSPVHSTQTNGTTENGRLNMNNLKRPNGKTGVMGLWI